MKNKIIIVDLDGTVADLTHRLQFIKKEKKDWDAFYHFCDKDKPIRNVIEVIERLANSEGYKVCFITGRSNSVMLKSAQWIHDNIKINGKFDLLMREDKDYRPDYIVKSELFKNSKYKKEDVLVVFEDRSSVVKMWRDLGLTVFQVAEGEF